MTRFRLLLMMMMIGIVSVHARVTLTLSNQAPIQGDVIWVYIRSSEPINQGIIWFNGKSFQMFRQSQASKRDAYRAISIVGVSRYMRPQKTKMVVEVFTDNKSPARFERGITVQSANFHEEHITLKPKKYALSQNKQKRSSDAHVLGPLFRTVTGKKQFSGDFIWPLEGRFSSEFGAKRVYNGTPSWSHAGIDIAAPKGTPVMATQSGTVILSKSLSVHGNTVMIDHGWGILSVYTHLDALKTKKQANVSSGDIIGTVGSTGVATGDHLHFGISIQNERVNPRHVIGQFSRWD